MVRQIAVLGSTGSVGRQALNVLAQFPEAYQVIALSGYQNISLLIQQTIEFKPSFVVVKDDLSRQAFLSDLQSHAKMPEILIGDSGLCEIASHVDVDTVLIGIVGFAGLQPTFAALQSGKTLLTGNKESIVTAGHLLKPYLKQILPLDSEHSAIQQCLLGCKRPTQEIHKIYLTASGGPFLSRPLDEFHTITPEQALKHPKWLMGNRISIDSASMMNKGFERIEAQVLFNLPSDKIHVVIHPQSIVHSAVAYVDGSILCQMGTTDMRLPILYGLAYPERWPIHESNCKLDLTTLGQLDFRPIETDRFPCLGLAEEAAKLGGSYLTALNAADEMAVEAFLNGQLTWLELPRVIEQALDTHAKDYIASPNLETITAIDSLVRVKFLDRLKSLHAHPAFS